MRTGGPSSTKYARSGDGRPNARALSRTMPGVAMIGSRASSDVSSAVFGLHGQADRFEGLGVRNQPSAC